MSQLGRLQWFASVPASDFTASIAQNAGSYLGLPATGLGNGGRGRVVRVTLRTVENKAWEVYVFGSSANNSGTIALNKYLGRVEFVTGDGKQIAAAGLYLYDKAIDIPCRDEDGTGKIHLVLVNRSTATAGGADQVALELHVDPTGN